MGVLKIFSETKRPARLECIHGAMKGSLGFEIDHGVKGHAEGLENM